MTKFYAGIGSRETPEDVLEIFSKIGSYLASLNFTLRSGGANGADSAFESGCNESFGSKEIYLPWKGFNTSESNLYQTPIQAYNMAKELYRGWDKFKAPTKKLLARDCLQVFGQNLDSPVDFIVCYTENGKLLGGTALAIRLANKENIPVFNAGSFKSLDEFRIVFYDFIKRNYATT